jgi:nitrate/nitrite transporter NarK
MGTTTPIPPAVALRVLAVSTLAFAVCFAAWLMFGVTGIPIRRELGLNASEFGLLTATPVLTGALFRLPLGIWTDRFGGRIVMFALLVTCAVPLWLSSYAVALWQFLLLGLALGLVGASFAVGTPYTARFFPKARKGLAMGVFGAGTTGAAINMFIAPTLVSNYGWQSVPRVYAAALIVTAALFWLLSTPDPGISGRPMPLREQLSVLRDPRAWKYWTDFVVRTIHGPASFHLGLPAWGFAMLLFVLGVSFACGMASTFKYISDDFPTNMGAVSGIVGLAGGLGGFLLPILFGIMLDLIGIYSSCFMLLYGIVWVSLTLSYLTEVRRARVIGGDGADMLAGSATVTGASKCCSVRSVISHG